MFRRLWFFLLSFVLFYLQFFLNVYAFDTNVVSEFRWKARTIKYAFDEQYNPEKLRQLRVILKNVLDQFHKDVGQIQTWIEIPFAEAWSMQRFFLFELDIIKCGYGEPSKYGFPTIIALSNASGCDLYTNMAHFLTAFGMLSPHHRNDRDTYIEVHFNNIHKIDHQNHDKCAGCLVSDNEIFKDYNYLSILHIPKYSVYAINPDLPIITERNDSISLLPDSYNNTGRTFSPTDIKIFRFLVYDF